MLRIFKNSSEISLELESYVEDYSFSTLLDSDFLNHRGKYLSRGGIKLFLRLWQWTDFAFRATAVFIQWATTVGAFSQGNLLLWFHHGS